ncbi:MULTISPECIES: hypothetical protein [Bradyrhizobium]|uniref:hypothetical protein n=1 Tax=Bradyrhizobium TaxID=374 RepID=UPI0004BBACC6|nr:MULTISPECIES: hypothetical protein [unclassified Bradyrhizobium]MDA9421847.1 hypothetical protein [Bradyrhizobium sp. CCBAU 53380]MDA9466084.1 hypothetical protein [Bradyrhizobium sp. CCBAU 53415]
MFSAFSSIDHHSVRSRTPTDTALKRLDGIGHVLSGLDISAIRTQDDVNRTLWTLDAASKCVRAVLAEFRTQPATEQLVRKSRNLIDLIERARDEVVSFQARGAASS